MNSPRTRNRNKTARNVSLKKTKRLINENKDVYGDNEMNEETDE